MEIKHDHLVIHPVFRDALAHITAARDAIKSLLVDLNKAERTHLPVVPTELPTLAISTVHAASSHPKLLAVCPDYDPAMIRARVEMAIQIAALLNEVEALSRAIGDTRNAWLAEAYRSLLSLYEVAKVLAERDSSLVPVVRPLGELFSSRQTSPKAKVSEEKGSEAKSKPPEEKPSQEPKPSEE